MLRKNTVKAAIQHNETDIVPYNVELTSGLLAKVTEHLGIGRADFGQYAGNHLQKANCNRAGSYIRDGFFKDEFGVVWDRTGADKDIGIVDHVLLPEPCLDGFDFPRPDMDNIAESTAKLVNNGRDTFKLAKIGTCYFERAWTLRGMENLLMDFLLEPNFVQQLLDNILQYNLQIIDTALHYDIDGFYFGDDYGQQNGLIMSPEVWRKFIKPGLARMFEKVKSAGRIVALHSCGNINAIFNDLIDIGLDVYQTVQPEVYDIKKLKTDFGDNLTFWGGISTQQALPFVTAVELKEIVKKTIAIMADKGGYIAGPTHRIPADVPVENVIALVEVLKEQ